MCWQKSVYGPQSITRIIMNWKYKAHLLAVLSRVPGGRAAYHCLQRMAGTNRLQLDRDLNRALELVDLIHEADGKIAGSDVFEVGTGWRPMVPMVFSLLGADRVVTVDVNPWLTLPYAAETWRALGTRLEEIATRGGASLEEVQQRYTCCNAHAHTLVDLLGPLGIEYHYPADARCTGLPEESMDLVVSSNVLEHIPAEIQLDIHRESQRILRPDGLAVHRFNPQDHYSTVDGSITNGNFLRYSSADWNWYGGSGLSYHNRLRSPEYRTLFEQAQLSLDIFRERVDQRTLQAIQDGSLPVHSEFSRFTAEEQAVDYVWVAARKAPVDNAVAAASASLQSNRSL